MSNDLVWYENSLYSPRRFRNLSHILPLWIACWRTRHCAMQGSRTRVARLVVCSANYALIVLLLTDYFHRREVCWKVATRKPESSQVCNRNNTTVFEIFVTLWRGCLVQKNCHNHKIFWNWLSFSKIGNGPSQKEVGKVYRGIDGGVSLLLS